MATITFGKSGSRPYCTLAVTQQSQSTANNTSTVKYVLTLVRPSAISSSATKSWSVTINGTKYTGSGTIGGSGNKTLLSGTCTVAHNTNGTKTLSFSGSCTLDITWSGVQLGTISGSGSMTLTTIPRYATAKQSLSSRTETTAIMNWSSDSTIDYIWYSTNNGSSWKGVNVTDGTSGSYTISGLTANTTYQVKTRVRSKASQLTTDSSALSVTTYAYPYCNSMPNFTIGNTLKLGFYNPLGRSITVNILGADGSQISNDTTTGTSISGYAGSVVVNRLYASIPNSKSGTYRVKVTYGSNVTTKTGGKYTVNTNKCLPTLETIAYADTNSTTTAITENNQQIIRNNSNITFTLSTFTALNSATLSSVAVTINAVTKTASLSGTTQSSATIDFGTINVSSDIDASIVVTDSRGITKTYTKEITVLDWVLPTAIITLQRQQNYYSATDLTVDADYTSLNGNNTITIQYQYKKTTDASYNALTTISNDVTETFDADNTYQWNVRVVVRDLLGQTTYNLTLDKGIPIVFFDRVLKSVGINCFPVDSGSLEVDGINLGKNVMSRSLSATLTNLSVNTYTIIPLDLSDSVGSKLTATNDGGIQIGDNVSKVLVSARMLIGTDDTAGNRHFRIVKNSYSNANTLAWTFEPIDASSQDNITITPTLADVDAGDVIYIMYYTPDADDDINGGTFGGRTSLTVEVIQ